MWKKLIFILLINLILILLAGNVILAESDLIITIENKVETSDFHIYLGDIAEIEGVTESDLDLLKNIELGRSPLPGYSKSLYKKVIEINLQNNGFDKSDYTLKMSKQVEVALKTQVLTKDRLLSFIENYVAKKLDITEGKLIIESIFCPQEISVPDQRYNLDIKDLASSQLLGNVSFPVKILIQEQVWKKIYIGLKIKVLQDVFVAKKNLIKGVRVNRNDFIKEEKVLESYDQKIVRDWNQELMQNQILRVPIGKDVILTYSYLETINEKDNINYVNDENNLEQKQDGLNNNDSLSNQQSNDSNNEELIKWGSEIQAQVQVGNIAVFTTVRSKGTGQKGEYILVENINTGYEFRAEIINSNLVRKELE